MGLDPGMPRERELTLRRPRSSSRAERRGRTRLLIAAALPWLGAAPVARRSGAVELRDPDGKRVYVVDRAAVASATRARKRLLGEHRAALAEVVGEVAVWTAGVDAVLAALKAALHDDVPLPWWPPVHASSLERTARALAEANPALAAALAAVGWWRVATPTKLRDELRWFERHRGHLAELATRSDPPEALVLALRRLAEVDGERLVAPLVATLGSATVHDARPISGEQVLALRYRIAGAGTLSIGAPLAPLGPVLLSWLAHASEQPVEARRAALRALAAMQLERVTAEWAAAGAAVVDLERRLGRVPSPTWAELRVLSDEVERLAPAQVHAIDPRRLARLLSRPPRDALTERLARLPDGGDPRFRVQTLFHLHDEVDSDAEVRWLVELIDAALAVLGPDGWPTFVRTYVDCGALDRPTMVVPAKRLGELLGHLVAGGFHDAGDVATATAVLASSRDLAGALVRLAVVRGASTLSRPGGVTAALAMGPTLDAFVDAVGILARAGDWEVEAAVPALVDALSGDGAAVVRTLVGAGERARLLRAAARVALARANRLPVPRLAPPPRVTTTPTRYPAALRSAIAALTALDAGAVASSIVDPTFPPRDATRRELAAIEARLADGGGPRLARRAENLRARLASPPRPSTARLARLASKLHVAVATVRFDRWYAELADQVEAAIARALGVDRDTPWLFEPRYERALSGLLRLDSEHRALARAVLAARCGDRPWDLRDAPWNRAWLARVARPGLDLAPWLDGMGRRMLGEPPLAVALEDDPLEVLRMGEHFSTCLSPHDINYFSVVVNAADINKRVVYARTADGTVAARCLIGLNDAGALVTFHCYRHDRRDAVELITRFIHELARRMGTVLVPTGAVAPLGSTRWYDDGPVDLTGSFVILEEGSDFREQLGTLAPDQLEAALIAAFAPLPIDGMALGLVLALPELRVRPALIEALLPLVEAQATLPREVWCGVARLALQSGLASRLGPRTLSACLQLDLGDLDDHPLVELLVERAPVRVLGRLRQLRRRDATPVRAAWHHAFARALEAVRRPAQAIAHYRAALDDHLPPDLEASCRARLATLEASAAGRSRRARRP